MAELNLAVALESFGQPFKHAIQTAHRVGATGVVVDARNTLRAQELSETGIRQLKKSLSDLNLRVAALRFPTRRGYDVVQDLDRRIDATKEAMRFAYALGASVVVNAVGRVPEDEDVAGYSQLQTSLGDLARYGQHVGAMLACETGSEPAERLKKLLDSLPEKSIGIAFNPGNLIVNDCFEDSSIKSAADSTLAVVCRDGVRDLAQGRGLEVPLGQGSAEFPEILAALEEQRYNGWFHVLSNPSPSAQIEVANAISYFKAL